MRNLINGQSYWLGSCYGTYHASSDSFLLGNCFIRRHQTIYRDARCN